jgi:transcriptional regulator with XRE-family HTH domain
LTQKALADKAGVGLRFIRDLEQGEKTSFRTDAVDKVLYLFGVKLGPVPLAEEEK